MHLDFMSVLIKKNSLIKVFFDAFHFPENTNLCWSIANTSLKIKFFLKWAYLNCVFRTYSSFLHKNNYTSSCHSQGGMKFATQISPLFNSELANIS